MEALKNLWETIKERLKSSWAETQESPSFIAIRERYEQLPPLGQKAVVYGGLGFITAMILWVGPISNIWDSSDLNSKFDERRASLKELLRIVRDIANEPPVANGTPPSALKAMFDGKITAAGIKPDQIRAAGTEVPTQNVGGADQNAVQYIFDRITIRQAVDLAYDLEHAQPGLKLEGLEMTANPQDPHFYTVLMKIASFAARSAELAAPAGKGIADAVKNKAGGGGGEKPAGQAPIAAPPPPAAPPPGQAPAVPSIPAPKRGGP